MSDVTKACTPWVSTIGGFYSKKLFEFFLMDSERTWWDKHAYIGHSSGWAKFFELGVFEFWGFWPDNINFSAIMPTFSSLEGGTRPFRGLNEISDLKLLKKIMMKKLEIPHRPYDSLNRQFSFWNA